MTAKALISPVVLGVAGAYFDSDGRVLLVRQSYMKGWRLPGGGVDRGEAPSRAVLREMAEEVGLSDADAEFFGLYSRRAGWATNVIALYRLSGGRVEFRPNWEVRAICLADPLSQPDGTTPATRRRLEELIGARTRTEVWHG